MAAPSQFFDRQEKARSLTARLLFIYVLGALALSLLPYATLMFLLGPFEKPTPQNPVLSLVKQWWDPDLFMWTGGAALLIVAGASLFKWIELSGSSGRIAEELGGTRVSEIPTEAKQQQLRNVVEEMCLAANLPTPEIYVLEDERGINAFACGMPDKKPVVAVTQGALDHFTRDELQAVVAHELGHIRNKDTPLNLRLVALAFGLFALTIVGRIFLYNSMRSRGDKNNNAIGVALFGLMFLLCGLLGIVFGQLMQAAVSRQREHLADADATQLTRNPQALANALRRIGGFYWHGRIETPKAMEAAHLFFASGVSSLFATHPPLEERIRALEPDWDGKFILPTD